MKSLFRLAFLTLTVSLINTGIASASGGKCSNFAGGSCPSSIPTGVTSFYFIDYVSGSDANSGTSESSSWQHSPGMANATGTAASHTPSAGEGWIFKGGVTVDHHAWPASVPWGGTETNPTYLGVDPGWYTGSSWSRPIFDGGGSSGYDSNSQAMLTDVAHNTNYFTLDNIEFTGLYWSSSCGPNTQDACGYVASHSFTGSSNWEGKNLYVHGWSHGATFWDPANYQALIGLPITTTSGSQSSIHDSVFDGSDTTKDCCAASNAAIAYNNYYAYLNNMMFMQAQSNAAQTFHDNYIEHQVGTAGTGSGVHSNCFHTFAQDGTAVGGTILVYNNHIDCKDAGTQAEGSEFENRGTVTYIFNNVYTFGQPRGISTLSFAAGEEANTFYVFNNSSEAYDATTATPGSSCEDIGFNNIYYFADNFCITNNGNSANTVFQESAWTGTAHYVSPTFTITCAFGAQTNLGTTQICAPIGAGNGTGYINFTETYPFAPLDSAAAATIGTGQNNSSYCTALSSIDSAAGTACLSDTTSGVAYDSTNHTVSWPFRTPVVHPSTGAWQNGAYEFANGTKPAAPTGLAASVN